MTIILSAGFLKVLNSDKLADLLKFSEDVAIVLISI